MSKINADILVIEDEMLMSALIQKYLDNLQSSGEFPQSKILCLESGWDLINADLSQVKVAIVDILLPQVTGVDLVKNFRQRFPKMGIVPVSGMATEPMKRSLKELLPQGPELLAKPLRKELFVEAFRNAWEQQLHAPQQSPQMKPLPNPDEPLWTVSKTAVPVPTPVIQRKLVRKKDAA